MKRIATFVLAGLLLVVGASVALAQTDDGDTTTDTSTEPEDDASPDRFGHRGEVLQSVLDDLVADGTLTQDQADAVIAALEEKRTEFQSLRDELRAGWDEAWADDVLTEDEVADLADGLPFADRLTDPDGPLAEYWEDGQLTRDELAEAREAFGFGRGGRHHHGPWADDTETPDTEESSFLSPDDSAGVGA